MNLNAAQQQAVEHIDGPCLVLAGPGSGKTATLTLRIASLIEHGIPAEQILVITFTKAAAMEMKERFNRQSDTVHPVTFGTFHSLFWGILQQELGLRSDAILMGERQQALLKEAFSLQQVDQKDGEILKTYATEISRIKNINTPIEEYTSDKYNAEEVRRVFSQYEQLKNKYRVIDFDDMLTKTYELFTKRPQVLEKWQKRFSYFLVDEMQDMNSLQYELIRMLSARTDNLFCVGDDDQSIYDFRGANPRVMMDFTRDYPKARQILLDTNYRCPGSIVEASLRMIARNEDRFDKAIRTTKPDSDIVIIPTRDSADEARQVISQMQALHSEGVSYSDMAVLYRNHSAANMQIEQLMLSGIPFYLKENMPNIYNHFVVKDIENYLHLGLGEVTRQRLLAVMNRPNRFIMRQAVEHGASFEAMERFYSTNYGMQRNVEAFKRDVNLIGKMSPLAAVNYIKNVVGYEKYLREKAIEADVEESEYLDVVGLLMELFKDCRTIKKAIEKLEDMRQRVDMANKSRAMSEESRVGLYTLHSSKGLEFDTVFIIGANEGMIPSKKAVKREQVESERRLFYVGVTRSKNRLFITFTNEKNRDRVYPSRFIGELGVAYSSPKASS